MSLTTTTEYCNGSLPCHRLAAIRPLVDAVTAAELAVPRQPDARMILVRKRGSTC